MIVLVLVCVCLQYAASYKPVVLVHGILSEASDLADIEKNIKDAHPGTNVTKIELYPELEAFVPLMRQLKYYRERIETIMNDSKDGIHLICHSQGGLLCQGVLEFCDDHNVHTFISLSAPIYGQFGVTDFVSYYLPWLKGQAETLTKYMYSMLAQTTLSISNYWKDPRIEYQAEYLEAVRYLPVVQCDPTSPRYSEQEATQRKKNFLRLQKLVLIGGPDDGVITPWYSSQFGFYDKDFNEQPMEKQQMFLEDWFGLRTLYERGGVERYTFDGVHHVEWHQNKTVFEKAIEPWLT